VSTRAATTLDQAAPARGGVPLPRRVLDALLSDIGARITSYVVFLLGWQILGALYDRVPGPIEVVEVLVDEFERGVVWSNFYVTADRFFSGLVVALVAGLLLGLLLDRSVDLVVAGQAAHWFREPDASRELARVLRPGGTVAYLWKYPAPDTPWVYLVDELLVELGGEPVRSIYGVGTVPELIAEPWHRYRRAVFEHPVPYTVESYVGYVASRFRIRRMVGERHGEFFERLRARLESEVVHGAFVERNLTYVVSARRRA